VCNSSELLIRLGMFDPEDGGIRLPRNVCEYIPVNFMFKGPSIMNYINNCPTRRNYIQFIYICKLLYMFRVLSQTVPEKVATTCTEDGHK
jgi:hypothetical protein